MKPNQIQYCDYLMTYVQKRILYYHLLSLDIHIYIYIFAMKFFFSYYTDTSAMQTSNCKSKRLPLVNKQKDSCVLLYSSVVVPH